MKFKSKFNSLVGYAGRITGGLIVSTSSFIYLTDKEHVLNSPEDFCVYTGLGLALYFVGDKIHKRELDYSMHKNLECIAEKLSPHNKESPITYSSINKTENKKEKPSELQDILSKLISVIDPKDISNK